jgi:ATP-binding cassette subfamily F protein uup
MDRLVDHLFVFEGDGKIKDFNGTYAEYRALKRTEAINAAANQKAVAAPASSKPSAPVSTLSNTERNEMRKLEKEIASAEARKRDILEKFNDANLDAAEAQKLSTELGALQESLEMKELRWLELAERG